MNSPLRLDFPEFHRYSSLRIDESSNLQVVQNLEWTLSQATTPRKRHLLVFADVLTIDGNVDMPGHNLTIVARRIHVKTGSAHISTAGAPGTPSYTGEVAEMGKDGALDSGNGQDGGSVSLFATTLDGVLSIDASGGMGGGAQKGGQGTTGSDGVQGTYNSPPTRAGDGNPGMKAGTPGNGGTAGSILVSTEQHAARVSMKAVGGEPGIPASNGEPGSPGATAGEASGRHTYQAMCRIGEMGELTECTRYEDWVQPAGEPGLQGSLNPSPVPEGTHGDPGQVLQQVAPASALAANLRPDFTSMLLNAACQDYLNLRLDDAAVRLLWLAEHLKSLPAEPSLPAPGAVLFPANVSVPPEYVQQFAACQARAESLVRQLSLGLDFYGQVSNHVTLLSTKFYLDTLDHMMKLAENIEVAYEMYFNAKDDKEQAVAAARRCKEEHLRVVEAKNEERRLAIEKIPELLSALKDLDEKRNELWTQVHTAQSSFRSAVERKAQGCDFDRVVAIAAACATLVTTAGAGAAALSTVAGFFADTPRMADGNPLPSGFMGTEYVVTTIAQAVGSPNKFAEVGQQLGQKIDGTPGRIPGLPSDQAKILTSAKELHEQLEPFLHEFAEASDFRKLIQEFVTTCTSRNNQVLEYNNHLTHVRALESAVQQAKLDIARLQDTVALNYDPFLADVVNMMDHAWQDSLAYVVKLLVRVHSAYKYYSLDDGSSLSLSDLSVKTLTHAQVTLWRKFVESKELYGTPRSELLVRVSLKDVLGPQGLRKLLDERKVTFVLPPDHRKFVDLCNVLISTIDVSLFSEGHLLTDYGVVLVHHGCALIFDAEGRPHAYAHAPIRTPYRREGNQVTIRGDANPDYVGVSPYGPWTLELDSHTRVEGPLSDIVLEMSGSGRARLPT